MLGGTGYRLSRAGMQGDAGEGDGPACNYEAMTFAFGTFLLSIRFPRGFPLTLILHSSIRIY